MGLGTVAIILATQEAEIRGIMVPGQLGPKEFMRTHLNNGWSQWHGPVIPAIWGAQT
jgi:hypothetical protein